MVWEQHGLPLKYIAAFGAGIQVHIEDLAAYLNGDTLIALWPDLYLPEGVRQAWEEQHPVLRAAATAAA